MTEIDDAAAAFIEAACVTRDGGHASGTLAEAQAILASHPGVASQCIHTAAILGDHALGHAAGLGRPAWTWRDRRDLEAARRRVGLLEGSSSPRMLGGKERSAS
jgi:hypothetical protein